MNGTPRLRSAFPQTPQSNLRRRPNGHASPGPDRLGSPRLPDVRTLQPTKSPHDAPLIPFDTIDAPSQRFYAFSIYTCLFVYRIYDWYILNVDETESLFYFLKWVLIDGAFLFGLPSFHIPWLEWTSATIMVLFLGHTIFDAILMFRIAVPFSAALAPFARMFFSDKEYAISEHRVKVADILNDHKLILGRQIINILPEGSALLNPRQQAFCLGDASPSVWLPLQINQTIPASIELIRHDFESSATEIIFLGSREVTKLRKSALKQNGKDVTQPLLLQYAVKKPGLYRLGKVIDETKLEVSHPTSEAYVVWCPSATIGHAGKTRCAGDLSNIAIELKGTPPLRLSYSKRINSDPDRNMTYRGIQPDDFVSPLIRQRTSDSLVLALDDDLGWASARTVTVPLNETLSQSGDWMYSIDEVADAFGNVVSYSTSDDEYERPRQKAQALEDGFHVFGRPRLALKKTFQGPLKLARDESVDFPVELPSPEKKHHRNQDYEISYLFTPDIDLSTNGEHGPNAQRLTAILGASRAKLMVSAPGLYSLSTVSSNACQGEVNEPTTFQIVNPPEPEVEVSSEAIFDKCAGRPIGLRVDLDFSGTPPFSIWYDIFKDGRKLETQSKSFRGLRGQLELKPNDAGHWKYQIVQLGDQVYSPTYLKSKGLTLEQDVKPSVSARLTDDISPSAGACIDDSVKFGVQMFGEGPWILEYELVHGNKRVRRKIGVEHDRHVIETDPLTDGGEYSLILTGVSDTQGCREALQQHAKVSVRQQKPKGAFGQISGKRDVKIMQSTKVRLPVRLSGEGPWMVEYSHTGPSGTAPEIMRKSLKTPNDEISVEKQGRYELLSVNDDRCPGVVDMANSAHQFEVDWIPRPSIEIPESPLLKKKDRNRVLRNEVCEGDDDAIDLAFYGQPPYEVKYQQTIQPDRGPRISPRFHTMNVAMHNTQMKLDTAQAGNYEYTFKELYDSNYGHDPKQHHDIIVEQRVNARPTASFISVGHVYSFCTGDEGSLSPDAVETIPITLTGKPPFAVDLEIKHHGRASRPTPLSVSNIATLKHDLTIPHRLLQTGNSFVSIRRVRDSRGCERLLDPTSSPRVQISVHDSPSITSIEPERTHYCVGERLAFSLSGMAPFNVFYDFEGKRMKASSAAPTFRRIAELPGNFTVTGVTDAGSSCMARTLLTKIIHAMPRVEVSNGKELRIDIHAGGEAEISFDFYGTPPFEFTYTRSENEGRKGGSGRQHGGQTVLETKTLESYEKTLKIKASEEGTYEVVAIRDRYCSFAKLGSEGELGKFRGNAGLLT